MEAHIDDYIRSIRDRCAEDRLVQRGLQLRGKITIDDYVIIDSNIPSKARRSGCRGIRREGRRRMLGGQPSLVWAVAEKPKDDTANLLAERPNGSVHESHESSRMDYSCHSCD